MPIRLGRRQALALSAGALALPSLARAQSGLPAGTIKLLIGFPAGGGTDVMGRIVVEKIRERTGANIVVENKGGASGTVAAEQLKNAAPDGMTLMLAPIASTVMAHLTFPKLPYDIQADFAPISLLGTFQLAYAISPTLGVNTLVEYIAWLKADPKRASFGTTAMGSLPMFFGTMLGGGIGVDLQAVPYRGAAPLVQDLMSGQVPAGTGALTDFLQHHRGGKVRILATSGAKRAIAGPDLPTFTELGYPKIVGDGWLGFYAPAKTPPAIVEAFNREIVAAASAEDVKKKLLDAGLEPRTTTSKEFADFVVSEIARWKPVVAASGYKQQ